MELLEGARGIQEILNESTQHAIDQKGDQHPQGLKLQQGFEPLCEGHLASLPHEMNLFRTSFILALVLVPQTKSK